MQHIAERSLAAKETSIDRQIFDAPLLLCSVWALASAVISLLLRLDIDSGTHAVGYSSLVRTTGLAVGLMVCVPAGTALARGHRTLEALLHVILTVMLFFAVALLGRVAPLVIDAMVFAIVVWGLRAVFPSLWKRLSLPVACCVAIVAFLLAINHVAILIMRGYAHPLGLEQALMGQLFVDTLYHAAIAGLLQQYGAVSIGLDGLQPIIYHAASHWLIGGLARWTGLGTIQAYSLFVPIIGGPLLFFHLLVAVARLRSADRENARDADLFTLVAIVVVIGSFRHLGAFWVSESYMVSLWFFLLAIQLMAAGLPPTPYAAAPPLLGTAILVTMASIAKISTGAVLSCGAVAWIAWRNPRSVAWTIVGAVVAGLPFLLVYGLTYSGVGDGDGSLIRPLATFRRYGYSAVLLPSVSAALLPLVWRCYPREQHRQALLVALGAMMVASIASSLVLDLPGGAVFYLVNPGILAALCLLASYAWPNQFMSHGGFKALVATAMVVIAVMTLGTGLPFRAARRIAALRDAIKIQSEGRGTQGLIEATLFGQVLTAIDENPRVDGVHVSPDVKAFWLGHTKTCWASSLVVQALAARPLLQGLHPTSIDCRLPTTYGWADYDTSTSAARSYDDAALCKAAARRRMTTILQVLPERELKVVDCSGMRL